MSSTVQSAGFMGSWVEDAMADRWLRNSCRSTARAGPKTAPSWSGRVRHLLETTPSPSGPCVFCHKIADKLVTQSGAEKEKKKQHL